MIDPAGIANVFLATPNVGRAGPRLGYSPPFITAIAHETLLSCHGSHCAHRRRALGVPPDHPLLSGHGAAPSITYHVALHLFLQTVRSYFVPSIPILVNVHCIWLSHGISRQYCGICLRKTLDCSAIRCEDASPVAFWMEVPEIM